MGLASGPMVGSWIKVGEFFSLKKSPVGDFFPWKNIRHFEDSSSLITNLKPSIQQQWTPAAGCSDSAAPRCLAQAREIAFWDCLPVGIVNFMVANLILAICSKENNTSYIQEAPSFIQSINLGFTSIDKLWGKWSFPCFCKSIEFPLVGDSLEILTFWVLTPPYFKVFQGASMLWRHVQFSFAEFFPFWLTLQAACFQFSSSKVNR